MGSFKVLAVAILASFTYMGCSHALRKGVNVKGTTVGPNHVKARGKRKYRDENVIYDKSQVSFLIRFMMSTE